MKRSCADITSIFHLSLLPRRHQTNYSTQPNAQNAKTDKPITCSFKFGVQTSQWQLSTSAFLGITPPSHYYEHGHVRWFISSLRTQVHSMRLSVERELKKRLLSIPFIIHSSTNEIPHTPARTHAHPDTYTPTFLSFFFFLSVDSTSFT
jgi:hypothetical protein